MTKQELLDQLLDGLTHKVESGGWHVSGAGRLLLLSLALLVDDGDVLETGYDAGYTTEALCLSRKQVYAVDNGSEYPDVKPLAVQRLEPYNDCSLITGDALAFLREQPDNSYSLIFLDDYHGAAHVALEAQEVRRILKPGGIVAFHDTNSRGLWAVVENIFPDWQRINLPFVSPSTKDDYGLGLVRKPK